jgi:hypothetical protein
MSSAVILWGGAAEQVLAVGHADRRFSGGVPAEPVLGSTTSARTRTTRARSAAAAVHRVDLEHFLIPGGAEREVVQPGERRSRCLGHHLSLAEGARAGNLIRRRDWPAYGAHSAGSRQSYLLHRRSDPRGEDQTASSPLVPGCHARRPGARRVPSAHLGRNPVAAPSATDLRSSAARTGVVRRPLESLHDLECSGRHPPGPPELSRRVCVLCFRAAGFRAAAGYRAPSRQAAFAVG